MSTLELVEEDLEGLNLQGMFKSLLIIHKQNTKEIIAVKEPFICDKTHVDLYRISRLQHLVIYIENSFVTNWQG